MAGTPRFAEAETTAGKQSVHVLGLFPGGFRRGLDIAAQMAADDVNNATDILQDYEFKLHISNINVSETKITLTYFGFKVVYLFICFCVQCF